MQQPKVGVGVFVWRDGKFLIGKRKGAHGANTWSVPGGHLEFGESWEACAKREVLEETGMEIDNVRYLTTTNDVFISDQKHFVTVWMQSDWTNHEPKNLEPEKCTALKWVDFQSLPSPLFSPCWENLKKAKPELFSPSQQR